MYINYKCWIEQTENITIVNNMFSNVTTASVQISTGLVPTSNITVADNEMISGFAGVRTWGWGNYDQIRVICKSKITLLLMLHMVLN